MEEVANLAFRCGGNRVVRLDAPRDEAAVQAVFERCAAFNIVVEGRPPGPGAAREFFESAPGGWRAADVEKLGVYDRDGRLIGLIESVAGYPEPGVTHLGLLMLEPDAQGSGLGADLYRAYESWAASHGAERIRLGVVADNEAGHRFWNRMGFTETSRTEPLAMGEKIQTIRVMERDISASGAGAPPRAPGRASDR